MDMNVTGYDSLADVLRRAYDQAAIGKGALRHACGRPFNEQPMQLISELLNTPDGMRYQAVKKIQESARMDRDPAVRELLGAINYLAGVVIYLESQAPAQEEPAPAESQGAPLLEKVNAERAKHGLAPLPENHWVAASD